jgi:hypothetical protein
MRREALLFVVLAAACRDENPVPRAPVPSIVRPYRPPADGHLSERQLQEYVAARKARPAAERAEAGGTGDGLDERRGGDELLWVRQKILESEMRLDEREADRREIEIDRKTAASLRAAAAASSDPSTKDSLARQAGDLERRAGETERALRKPRPADDPVNDGLVARYRRQIESATRQRP